MRVLFTGVRSLQTTRLPAAEMHRRFHRDGFFHHNGNTWEQNGVLTIGFSPTIFLNQDLTGTVLADVQAHEQRHVEDFRRIAGRFQPSLERACRHPNPEWESRWNWFLYDLCVASASFHRSVGDPMVEICQAPSGQRPAG
jgi:hypothetical protein